jgi:hypothetical protein
MGLDLLPLLLGGVTKTVLRYVLSNTGISAPEQRYARGFER